MPAPACANLRRELAAAEVDVAVAAGAAGADGAPAWACRRWGCVRASRPDTRRHQAYRCVVSPALSGAGPSLFLSCPLSPPDIGRCMRSPALPGIGPSALLGPLCRPSLPPHAQSPPQFPCLTRIIRVDPPALPPPAHSPRPRFCLHTVQCGVSVAAARVLMAAAQAKST